MNVDGVEVDFEPEGEQRLAVHADGRLIGHVVLVSDGRGLYAYRENGEAIQRASPWGGRVTTRFATRELAVRALLEKLDARD